ncbi:MAG: hypothetical protein NTV79_00435 [Candidatus Aureabacteria bacterium]|nr:hypothetical protein [Candidatus Auribacterota bacterium]
MRRLRFIMVIALAGAGLLAGAGNGLGQSAYVPFFIWVEETSPIRDARGDLLAGSNPGRPDWNELTGDLIQVLFVGPNGMIDLPVNRVSPSGDDTLAAAARIGGGMPYNWEESESQSVRAFKHQPTALPDSAHPHSFSHSEPERHPHSLGAADSFSFRASDGSSDPVHNPAPNAFTHPHSVRYRHRHPDSVAFSNPDRGDLREA